MTRANRGLLFKGLAIAMVLGLIAVAFFPTVASAHGRRTVAGKFQFVIGFLAEPAFQGGQNGIDLTVCDGECKTKADGSLENPIEGLEKTLKAKVVFGSQSMDVPLTARFRQPGKYNGVFFPTAAGEYTFQFSGDIKGTTVSENFVSGKDGFSSVEATTALQFPEKAADTTALVQQVKEAKDSAASASTFGIIGLGVGGIGLLVAIVAVFVAINNRKVAPHTALTKEEVGLRG